MEDTAEELAAFEVALLAVLVAIVVDRSVDKFDLVVVGLEEAAWAWEIGPYTASKLAFADFVLLAVAFVVEQIVGENAAPSEVA